MALSLNMIAIIYSSFQIEEMILPLTNVTLANNCHPKNTHSKMS